jgi:hypothetical protein
MWSIASSFWIEVGCCSDLFCLLVDILGDVYHPLPAAYGELLFVSPPMKDEAGYVVLCLNIDWWGTCIICVQPWLQRWYNMNILLVAHNIIQLKYDLWL